METLLAIDTETTGLFPHKGCQAFMLTATSGKTGDNYMWRFPVDPFTRRVSYDEQSITEIKELIYEHNTIIFHHANFDIPILRNMGICWHDLFRDKIVHDTMVMSHVYKSSNKHGLKENAVMLLRMSDEDEKALEEATKKSRDIAKKLGWYTAEKDSEHPSLIGANKEPFRADYWIPAQIAEHELYPKNHPWRTICGTYAIKDTERTIGLFIVLRDILLEIPNTSAYAAVPEHNLNYPPIEYTGTLYDKYLEARQNIEQILDMQDVGIPVKPRALALAKTTFATRKEKTLQKLRSILRDDSFNPDSTKQLRIALFQKLGHAPVPGKVGKDGPSTDKDVISKLLSEAALSKSVIDPKYEFLIHLKDFRKEKATYGYLCNYDKHSEISEYREYRNKPERLLRTTYRQVGPGTGRLSSENPNTTNVGKKDMFNPFADEKDSARAAVFAEILGIDLDERFSLRNVFGPRSGEQWTCIDYDQFQLRIFAVVSESHELVESFNRGEDIHNVVACRIFKKDTISDVERTAAKAINFGLLFGAGPAKIELLAGVPGLYNLFMSAFPKAKKYLESQSAIARSRGYVNTVGGYRLYVPRDAPHAASCYVIQGTEAEIVKRAMVGVHTYRKRLSSSSTNNPQLDRRTQNLSVRQPMDSSTGALRSTEGRHRQVPPASNGQLSRRFSNQSSQSSIQQGRETASRLLAPHFELLMMVHDELIFTSRSMRVGDVPEKNPAKPKYLKEYQDTPEMAEELSNIMRIMEDAGRAIGIPCKVDAKITTTDWANRNSLVFER